MTVVNKFNVNKQQVTLDADIIENMSANDVSYNASTQYDENTVGNKLSELSQQSQQVIYDVTVNNDGATFASLSELLSDENLSTLIPVSVRCGGMSIRFVQSSDNKYVQYRLMNQNWSVVVTDWQGEDAKPTKNSNNLVKSGGILERINEFSNGSYYATFPFGGYYKGSASTIIDEGSKRFPLTDFIDISNCVLLSYKLRLGYSAYILTFFDENKEPLVNLSIFYIIGKPQTTEGIVDLTEPKYAIAKYVRASNYVVEETDYYLKVFSKNLHNLSELDVENSLTSDKTDKPLSAYQGKVLKTEISRLRDSDLYFRKLNLCALGDSITEGHMNNYVGWPDYLFEMLGNKMGSLKIAHSGAILRTMADECTSTNMADKDVVIIMGGTNQNSNFSIGSITDLPTPDDVKGNTVYSVNDYILGGPREKHGWHPSPIYNFSVIYKCTVSGNTGNITTSDISSMSTSIGDSVVLGNATFEVIGYPTWYADLWRVTKKIFNCNPNIRLLFCVPIKMTSAIGVSTWKYKEKFQAIRDFCEYNSIQFIDLEKTFTLTPYNVDLQNYEWGIMADVIHPNENGYKLLAKMIAEYI